MFGSVTKRILAFIIIIALLLTFYVRDIAKRIIQIEEKITFYEEIIVEEVNYITDIQLSDGAIPMYEVSDTVGTVNPYFANLSAYALAKTSLANNEVKAYLEWYLIKLNDARQDPFGVDGTIFDYEVRRDGGLNYQSLGKYDSVDSYAATFLMVLSQYAKTSNDFSLILKNEVEIERVYKALMEMKDNDLFISTPLREVKYTMDNAEVFYGLTMYLELLENVLIPNGNLDYGNRKDDLTEIINTGLVEMKHQMYDTDTKVFHVGLDMNDNQLRMKTFNDFYPDMSAQIFPVVFESIPSNSPEAQTVFSNYETYYDLNLESVREHGDTSFYWTVQAFFYSIMGDSSDVYAYITEYKKKLLDTHKYPIYNTEVAWIILTCENEIMKLNDNLDKIDRFGFVRKLIGK